MAPSICPSHSSERSAPAQPIGPTGSVIASRVTVNSPGGVAGTQPAICGSRPRPVSRNPSAPQPARRTGARATPGGRSAARGAVPNRRSGRARHPDEADKYPRRAVVGAQVKREPDEARCRSWPARKGRRRARTDRGAANMDLDAAAHPRSPAKDAVACGQSRLEAQARDERGIHCDDRAARSDRSRARIEHEAALAQRRTTRTGESKRTFPARPSASHSAISPVPLQTRQFCARPRRRLAATALRPSARARGTRASTRERGRPEHDHNHHVRDEPRRRRARVARTPSTDRERVEPSARAASHGRPNGSERARRVALTSGTRFRTVVRGAPAHSGTRWPTAPTAASHAGCSGTRRRTRAAVVVSRPSPKPLSSSCPSAGSPSGAWSSTISAGGRAPACPSRGSRPGRLAARLTTACVRARVAAPRPPARPGHGARASHRRTRRARGAGEGLALSVRT